MRKEAILAMEGIVHSGVKMGILAQDHEVAAMALSGIDEGRTVRGISYPVEIFADPPGFVPSVVAHIETVKWWQTNPSLTSENDVF
jgi:hypothetical protein